MESIWWKENKIEIEKSEITKRNYEVIVIGAGMAGLLSAYYLMKSGLDVIVLEANRVGSGQSGKSTAKITSQHGLIYSKMVNVLGLNRALLYAQAQQEAIDEYEELILEENIECDFKRVDSFLYSEERDELLLKELKIASKLGISAYFTKQSELVFPINGALCFQNQAQFNPVLFMKAIASKVNVVENCRVLNIKGHVLYTSQGTWYADKIVMATHYPIKNVPGFYFMREHQERSYVMAISNVPVVEHMYYGVEKDGVSIRSYKEYLLLGQKGKRVGEKDVDAYKKLYDFVKRYYPSAKIEGFWSAQDCMPHDEIPFVGRYSLWKDYLYVITGFQKWGMSMAMVSALLITDLCNNKKNPYMKLFSPQRIYFKAGYKNCLKDTLISTKGLYKGWLCKAVDKVYLLRKGEAKILEIHGKKCACYKDEKGKLHVISSRCTHLGCELVWNEVEHRWDCPCHGSSFTVDGHIITEPAIKQNRVVKNDIDS